MRETAGPAVPGWLNEGLAQWLEGPRAPMRAAARAALEGGEPMPLERLTGSLIEWGDPADVRRAYASAVLFVDAIARLYGESVLFEVLRAIPEGVALAAAFQGATRVSLEVAYGDLRDELAR